MSRNDLSAWAKVSSRIATAFLLTLALLTGSGCGQKTKVEDNRYTALGEVMAGKTSELCGSKRSIVLVVSERDNGQPTAFGQTLDAFRRALGKGVQIVATESVPTPALALRGIEPLPAEKFAELLQKYSTADYLVSFVGLPVLTPAQIEQLSSPRPQVVAVVVNNAPSPGLFARKVICLAALPKLAPDPAAAGAGSVQEQFEAHYQMVTPETAKTLLR